MNAEEDQPRFNRALRDTLAVVMAGGRGERLYPLTARHSKPAIPFGGNYRIIDFTLSNCINSGLHKICVLTQYRAHSLIQHMQRGWSMFRPEFNEFIELLPAQERYTTSVWYQGTADAVYQNLDIIHDHAPTFVLVLAGDHIYKMDYGRMLATHLKTGADVTVGCVEVPLRKASNFGLMIVDEEDRVVGFEEKPEHPKPAPGQSDVALASMGIYLFSTPFMVDVLSHDAGQPFSSHDFGKDILPASYRNSRVMACRFRDAGTGQQHYWRDVGTIDAYWEANLELIGITPSLNLYDKNWPILTTNMQLPPAKFVFDDDDRRGMAVDSVVSAGCIISGAVVRHSLLSNNVRVNSYSVVEDSVLLPGVDIGRHCHVKRAVIDSGCRLPRGSVIGHDHEQDAARFHVTPGGVVVVSPEMLGQHVSYDEHVAHDV